MLGYRSPARFHAIALLICAAAALSGCADEPEELPSIPSTTVEAAGTRPASAFDARALDDRIARLERALDRHAARLENLHDRTDRTAPASTSPAAAPTPDLAKAIDELRKTVASLQVRLADMPTGVAGVNSMAWRPSAGLEPRKLRTRFSSRGEGRKQLLLMSYRQVMEHLGPPVRIWSDQGQRVTWNYPDGGVSFIDGFVSDVFMPDPGK